MSNEAYNTQYLSPDLKLSNFVGRELKMEVMFEQHMLVWLISGETKIVLADVTHFLKSGDIFLIPRNQLANIISSSIENHPHKAVATHFSLEFLKAFYSKNEPKNLSNPIDQIRVFSKHPLLESCMASLIPYFGLEEPLPIDLANLKIEEALKILRNIEPDLDGSLANFEEPGKIELSAYMEKHFMFNMPLEKFAYLTGRSLTTFQRDFQKIYQTTPQKWLTHKRLELAHYQIKEKRLKPSDVYFETGFENLSHFSFAFKKQFGVAPSQLLSIF